AILLSSCQLIVCTLGLALCLFIAAGSQLLAQSIQLLGFKEFRKAAAQLLKLLPGCLRVVIRVPKLPAELRSLLITLDVPGLLAELGEMRFLCASSFRPQPVASRMPGLVTLPAFETGHRIVAMLDLKLTCPLISRGIIPENP